MSQEDDCDVLEEAKSLNIGAVVPEFYKDVISPAAKEVGKGLATVGKALNIALVPVSGLVWGYDKIEEYVRSALKERFRDVDPADIQQPPIHVAGPLLESLRYTGDQEELRKMYANLLASSMDKNTVGKVHPSFVEIINQLSPDEAKILSYLPTVSGYPDICWNIEEITDYTWNKRVYDNVSDEFYWVCTRAEVACVDNSKSYLDNLRRLVLLEFVQEVGSNTVERRSDDELVIGRQFIEHLTVTKLGCQFIETCVINTHGKNG